MVRMRLLITVAVALAVSPACGQSVMPSDLPALPSDAVGPPASEAPPSNAGTPSLDPGATGGSIPPLACEDWVVGIADFPQKATGGGVSGILEATRTTQAVNHEADDQIQQVENTTRIVRDGEVVFEGEWHLADDGTWLLAQYKACQMPIPSRPEE